ncbi:Rid family detoxifying hydrolase [Bordetella sp. 15P40C-2]|uniref:Rid family detoxifying hydrolase n=1 Tax=Bordetella sp. 15P40C-2 TaxID=2572246 RepID=UPI001329CDB6|nr:Rid family detoxifying hydrolase [Bordetella sp. 15P40C-2]MVW73312.1 RidA family protein [Bordetella sp. 15P40C-2]
MSKQIIHTDAAPAAVGPYSQAVAVQGGKTVYLSGQIGLEPGTGDLASENFDAQVRQAFANMTAVIEAAGGTLNNIVKLTLFLTDLSKFTAANAIMSELIPQPYPARSTIGVASLPKDAQFEVEAILVLP